MRLSKLQHYILARCYLKKNQRLKKQELIRFYNGKKTKPKDLLNVVTKSVERLINRGFAEGYGRRTPHRWYITEIRLMPKGRRLARRLLGEQQRLPLKINPNYIRVKQV